MRLQLPIRARLALVSGALMAVVLIGLATFLYTRLEAGLLEAVDAGLRSRAAVLVERLGEGGGLSNSGLAEGDEAFAQLLAGDGTIIDASAGLAGPILPPEEVAGTRTTTIREALVQTVEEPVPARLLATPTASGDLLVVGVSLEDQQEALAGLVGLLAVGVPGAVVMALAVGWVVAGGALRPVERLRLEADAISASEPGRQLAVPTTNDELSRLAESLNRMLTRLEEAVARERRFVAAASHELRTPLANLRAELDLALRRARTPTELTEALASVRDETERLSRLAEDLLVLARASADGLPLHREPTDLNRLVSDTIDSFAARAEAAGIELVATGDREPEAKVDRMRVSQALGNLIDNALRHTPAGSRVVVSVSRAGGDVHLTVADSGPGFPDGFVPAADDPFSRPDAARGRVGGGSGVGLSIVRAIAQAHGGTLRAENGGAGARVTVTLSA